MTRGVAPKPVHVRFFAFVEKTENCWNWTGARQPEGYGRFGIGRGVTAVLAHRWSYEYHVGPIPADMTIDHLCRNTSCVNPEHMEVVSREVNARRGNPNTDKTHCDQGHEFTEENTYRPPGRPHTRGCRECRKQDSAARYRARKAAAVAARAEALPRAG